MILFRIFWIIDAITTATVLYFFVIGLGDNSISCYNAGIWAIMVILPIALLIGSCALKIKNKLILAKLLLALMAIPVFLYFLFYLLLIISNPKWN